MDKSFNTLMTDFLGKIDLGLLFKVAIELMLFVIVLNVINKLINKVFVKIILRMKDLETKKQYNTLRLVSMSVADTILILFFGTNILQDLGIDMKPILATAGVLGIAVGFGAQRFVQDVIAGLNILLTGQIRVGDVVKVQGVAGTVERVTLTMVVLRSYEGCVHYIRNGLIDIITNQTRDFSFAVLDVTVAYKEDIAHVMEVLKETGDELKATPDFEEKILDDIEILGLDSFLDSSILVKCRIKTYPQFQWEVKRKFNLMIKEKFDKLGIEIPFPQLVVTKAE
ncbi:MAG: mechanosensitive ion channel family protein [Candidatus Gastranaerophilales bacterium]|nr:mechanosensitive ion channel family protein [Candidatus Gastranaerophilales bacterium]